MAAAAFSLVASAPSASAKATHFREGSFGPDGTASTSFENPASVAVDQQTGDVYVLDSGAESVYKFDEAGLPVPFGGTSPALEGNRLSVPGVPTGERESQLAVDPVTGVFYVNSYTTVRAFQSNGEPSVFTTGPGAATNEIPGFAELLGIAVDSNGSIYASDYAGEGGTGSVSVYSRSGSQLSSFATAGNPAAVAVNSVGHVYVALYEESLEEFVPSTFPVTGTTTYSSSGKIDPAALFDVTVDRTDDDYYVTDRSARTVSQYTKAGEPVAVFAGPGEEGSPATVFGIEPSGIGINETSGNVFITELTAGRRVAIYGPLVSVPIVTTGQATAVALTSARLNGSINPEGSTVESCVFEYGLTEAYGSSLPCSESGAEVGTGNQPVQVHADLGELRSGSEYHFRLAASSSGRVFRGSDSTFLTLGPSIRGETPVSATGSEAGLSAEINPRGLPTTFEVEYGPTTSYGSVIQGGSVGSDETFHLVLVGLQGLTPNTTYHWRVVATNASGSSSGDDATFTTVSGGGQPVGICPNEGLRTGPSAKLPNCRAYELVTPVEKNNTDISNLGNLHGNIVRLNQSTAIGDGFTYTTSQALDSSAGAPYASQYIATRGPSGWLSKGVAAPQGISSDQPGTRIDLESRWFVPSLCASATLNFFDPPLASGAPSGVPNLYRRTNCGAEGFDALSTEPHPNINTVPAAPNVGGGSRDGRCIAFSIRQGEAFESCDGQLRTVSVLPDGVTIEPGVIGSLIPVDDPEESLRQVQLQNAVSADGSQIYWTSRNGDLYLRENADEEQSNVVAGQCEDTSKACTTLVSKNLPDQNAGFYSASADGKRAFYTEKPSGAGNGVELYLFSAEARTHTLLATHVEGFVGADEDASRIYFVSTEAIEGLGVKGLRNIYFDDLTRAPGDQLRLVGTLADGSDGGSNVALKLYALPELRTSRVTPDGLSLAFASNSPLTGYDNRDVVTGQRDYEVFVYHAGANGGTGDLTCVSCNPSGQRPSGRDQFLSLTVIGRAAGLIPNPDTSLHGSRLISDNGDRVFFDSYDALIPGDINGREDVYQWEAPDPAGSSARCTATSPSYSRRNGGCLSLISTGVDSSDSEVVEASADGRDVFFSTNQSLIPQDPGLRDIYDAREYGGYPAPNAPARSCEGEGCQPPAGSPADSAPSSSIYVGPENFKHHRKHRHHKKKHHSKKHRRAGGKGRHAS